MNATHLYNVTQSPGEHVAQNDTYDYYYNYEYQEFTIFVYEAFDFEHPIYMYIWEILTVISTVIAILFILTLTRKKLRSVTSYILCAISISDSLTGLVTLPTYIMVYRSLHMAPEEEEQQGTSNDNSTLDSSPTISHKNAYIINGPLCESFMISKYFLSKLFHTVSIWLTVFLGIQRCLSVWLPFTARSWFSNKKTIIIFVTIVVLAPILHGFHVFNEKTKWGYCVWSQDDDCIDGSCVQLWVELIFRHLTPCVVLTVTTVLMVKKLVESSFKANRSMSVKKFQRGTEVVDDEHRQVSRIVLGIMIVFLLTEVPYGLFLLYLAVIETKATHSLETNRAIGVVYEITMVLSFNANFVIYMAFNARFKREMKRLLTCCRSKKKPIEEIQTSQSQSKSTSQAPATELSSLS